jgi:hypothetical protein
MGAHASYPLIIFNLVSLKTQFQFFSEEKFQGVIKELLNYEIYPNSENEHLPIYRLILNSFRFHP